MSDYIGVVTNTGQAKIAAAIGGTALNLTTIRVGDGNGAPITPNAAMTDLVRRVGAAYPIISSGRDPVNANHWRVTALIPVDDGPFDIREIGVWDAAGDMIAIARHVLVEKRTPAQGAAVELLTDIVFPVSETAQVTVQVTPSAQISIFQMLRAGFTVVESATLANPPGAPILGRTHVVPAGATGAWVGLAGYVVQWNGIAWVGVNVPIGFHVVDQSNGIDTGARWLERTATGWAPGVSRLVQKQPGNYVAVVGGTANALTATLDPAITSYAEVAGTPLRLKMPFTNTGPATADYNTIGPRPVVRFDGSPLAARDYVSGDLAEAIYDPIIDKIRLISPRSVIGRGCLLVYNGGGAFATGVEGAIPWDTRLYDTDGMQSLTVNPSRIVIPAGVSVVRITAQITYNANATGSRKMRVLKNGVGEGFGLPAARVPNAGGADVTIINGAGAEVPVNPGDYLEVLCIQDSGTVLPFRNGGNCWVSCQIIR